MKKIDIELQQAKYRVMIGKNIFTGIEGILKKNNIPGKILVVADKNVLKLHKKRLDFLLKSKYFSINIFEFDAREKNKNLKSIEKIYSALQKNNFGRDSAIVALGGGITGDISGFAASTYMRGIKYIQIPTTLLAAVDSSVGGKTGVNFNNAKNFIGSFYQPELVIIDPAFFSTLHKEEIICGLGEMIKTAYLSDDQLFSTLSGSLRNFIKKDFSKAESLINDNVKFKASVVMRDEKETGLRKILNFGHTFAHALETESDFKVKHGQAVIFGIVCAHYLSYQHGFFTGKELESSLLLVDKVKDLVVFPAVNSNDIYNAMLSDKKNRNGRIKFVVIKNTGRVFIDFETGKEKVIKSIDSALKYFQN